MLPSSNKAVKIDCLGFLHILDFFSSSTLPSRQNSLQNKHFTKGPRTAYFILAEHDGNLEMGWQDCHGLGDMGLWDERGVPHHVTLRMLFFCNSNHN